MKEKDRDRRAGPRPMPPGLVEKVPTKELLPCFPVTVPLSSREGVYVQVFKCGGCGLEFATFSWQASRHSVGRIGCPECGERRYFFHRRRCWNHNPEFGTSGEIWQLVTALLGDEGEDMDDSRMPPQAGTEQG